MNYFDTYISPVGLLTIFSDEAAITQVCFSDKQQKSEQSCKLIEEAIGQFEEYFEGTRLEFQLPLQPAGTPFQQTVWNELLKIAPGHTISYMELAVRLGDPKKVRAVGLANGKNPIAIIIPCHRVIGANGKLVGYAGGLWRKKWLLNHENSFAPSGNTLF